jgi:DUF4097 and DUF4098 domain-containing protein YvlB
MLNSYLLIPLGLLPGLLLTGCIDIDFGPTERYRADFHYSYDLQPGGKLSLETFNGPVEVSGWDQSKVEIEGEKYASTERDLRELRIDVENSPASVAVRAVRPPGTHHLFSGVGANFRVHVPRTALLENVATTNGRIEVHDLGAGARLRTSNGRITGESIAGPVDAKSSNGAIDMHNIEGSGAFRTSNGSITLTFSRAPSDAVHAETSNGSITLHLPPDTAAHIEASTSNSRITSEFDLVGHVHREKHRVTGDIGKSGPLVDLGTSNGSIRILRN